MTQRQAIRFTRLQLLEQYRSMFPELVSIAVNSDLTSFKSYIGDLSSSSNNMNAAETIMSLLDNDGKTVRELSTGEDIRMGIISSLYSFLRGDGDETDCGADALLDVYYQLCRLDSDIAGSPDKEIVSC